MIKNKLREEARSKKERRSRLLPAFTLAGMEDTRHFRKLLILLAAIYCLTFSSVPMGDTDDQLMLTSAFSFQETGKFLAPSRFATKDFNGFRFGAATSSGEVYSKYPPGYPLILFAFLPLAALAGRLFGSIGPEVVLCFPSVLALLGTTALIWRAALRLGYGEATARLLALAFGLGSFAWGYTGTNYNEPWQALCATAAFYCLLAALQEPQWWRSYALAGGFALGYGILLRPYFAILAPMLVLGALAGWLREHGLRNALMRTTLYAAPALLASAYLLITNLVLFGGATNFGYANEHFDTPFLNGFLGLLVNPRKGLLWFFPLAALVPWSAWKLAGSGKRWAVIVLAAAASAQVILISKWWGYESGRAWGDRLILGVVPFVVLLAGALGSSRNTRRAAVVLIAAGIILNAPGILVNRSAYEKIVRSSDLPHESHDIFSGQIPGHLWLLAVEATGPFLGHGDANPLWNKPPWAWNYPQSLPPPYRDAMNPILNPWPLRLFLPASAWTRWENGYMRSLLEIAVMRFEQGNMPRALELLDRGLAMNPSAADFLAAKGMVYFVLRDPVKGLHYFDNSIQSNPDYDLGLYGRGLCMEALGDIPAARASYVRLLAAPQGMLDKKEVRARLDRLSK